MAVTKTKRRVNRPVTGRFDLNEGPVLANPRDVATTEEMPEPSAPKTVAKCEVCGNEYDKSFTVVMGARQHTFDSFECAIKALAPACAHCGCKIIGHGVEQDGTVFCCAHCAAQQGATELKDRA
jgi:hypothetical protein